MLVLALDLATQTGVALGEPGTRPVLWTERFGEAGDPHGWRFAAVMRWTNRLIEERKPGLIAIEQPVTGKAEKAAISFVLVGLRACVMGVASMRDVPCRDYAVATVRQHFIGHGRLKSEKAKAAVFARCQQLGWNPRNKDESDAAAIWDLACSEQSRAHQITTAPGLFQQTG